MKMEHQHLKQSKLSSSEPNQDHQKHSKNQENPSHGHMGHDHHKMMISDFKKRFWISIILSIPVLILSPMIQEFIGFKFVFRGSLLTLFSLSSILYFYGGWPFLKGLKDEIKKGAPGMMTLIAVAITVAYVYSSAVVFGLLGKNVLLGTRYVD